MTKRDIVGYLDISMKTLYNWEKERPNLYKTIMKGLAFDDIVELNKASYEKAKELQEKFSDGKKNWFWDKLILWFYKNYRANKMYFYLLYIY